MTVSAEIVTKSHLNDAMLELQMGMEKQAMTRLNFVKYLIHILEGDLTGDIDPKEMFDTFLSEK